MRKLKAVAIIAASALLASPALSADYPQYTPPDLPPVDYGLGASFYLRGSAAVNALWASDADYACGCTVDITGAGYGYSLGVGVGYETGDGFRADLTVDYLSNNGLTDGFYTMNMRSGLLLANAYYDFSFDELMTADGGWGGYVGFGLGGSYNHTKVSGPIATPNGNTVSAAAALMTGVTYDMGAAVADLGYRMIYMPNISNGVAGGTSYYINNPTVHELRGTVRYRFN